jgi:hypothetical protein
MFGQVAGARPVCSAQGSVVSWRGAVAAASSASPAGAAGGDDDGGADANAVTFCVAKAWLLEHMPSFDLNYLPPSVS